jgi:hypoxanthine-DNA glycosylase
MLTDVVDSDPPLRSLRLGAPTVTAKVGLAPVVDQKSRVLVLGTLPGDESLRLQRYYSNPTNQFWRLLARVLGAPTGDTYEQRVAFLSDNGIALWDVLRSAERPGSTDAAIMNPVPNDFVELFSEYPDLRRVAFNGGKAEALWRKYIAPSPDVPHSSLANRLLPSSSGSPGRHVLPFEEKVVRWKQLLSLTGV